MVLNLSRMKWLAIALPLAFVVFLALTKEAILDPAFGAWSSNATLLIVLAIGVFVFATMVFGWLERSQAATDARTHELEAMNELGRKLTESITRDEVVALVLEAGEELLPLRAIGLSYHDTQDADAWTAAGDDADDLRQLVGPGVNRAALSGDAEQVTTLDSEAAVLLRAVSGNDVALFGLLSLDAAHALPGAMRLLRGLANHAAAALERCRLFEEVQRREERTRVLYGVGLEIASSQELSRVLRQVTSQAYALVGARAAALCLVDEADGKLNLVETAGEATAMIAPKQSAPLPMMSYPLGNNPPRGCRLVQDPLRQTLVRSPLVAGTQVVGELCVIPGEDHAFGEEDRTLLASLADMAAIAINNSRLVERERQVAVLEERDHLAREMHDTLAQVLGYLHLKAASTKNRLASGEIEHAEGELQEMQDLAHEAYVDVREAILGLRETVAPGEGIIGSISQYLQKFRRQSGVEAQLIVLEKQPPALLPEAEIQLVRVVQESLTNVRKHALATRVLVRVERAEGGLQISIEDNGRGFDASRLDRNEGRSFGITSMRERIERAGGRFSIESEPGAGTRIVVSLPVKEGAHHVRN